MPELQIKPTNAQVCLRTCMSARVCVRVCVRVRVNQVVIDLDNGLSYYLFRAKLLSEPMLF